MCVRRSYGEGTCSYICTHWWGIGHGVGLEVHEWPFIGYQHIVDEDVYKDGSLEENMVISLEPIISFPDTGELQIEDQFVAKKGGAARLNDIPLEILKFEKQ